LFNYVFSVSQVVYQYPGMVSLFEVWMYEYKEYVVKRSISTLGYYRKTSFMDGSQSSKKRNLDLPSTKQKRHSVSHEVLGI